MIRPSIYLLLLVFVQGQIPTTINSIPAGANIKLNGREAGIAPLELILGIGEQDLEASLEGFVAARKTINIQDAKSLIIEFRLKKLHRILFKTKETDLIFIFNKTDTITSKKVELFFEEGQHSLQVFGDQELLEEKLLLIDSNQTIEYIISSKIPIEHN